MSMSVSTSMSMSTRPCSHVPIGDAFPGLFPRQRQRVCAALRSTSPLPFREFAEKMRDRAGPATQACLGFSDATGLYHERERPGGLAVCPPVHGRHAVARRASGSRRRLARHGRDLLEGVEDACLLEVS